MHTKNLHIKHMKTAKKKAPKKYKRCKKRPEHERAEAARWAGIIACSEAEFDPAVEARHAYMFSRLDRPLLDCWPRATNPAQPPSKRWHARVVVFQRLDTEHWQQQQQQQHGQPEQHAGSAHKKQKH